MAGVVDGDDVVRSTPSTASPTASVERRRSPALGPHRARRRGPDGLGLLAARPRRRVDRHRHLGRRLRPARRRRAAARRADRLPRRPHGRRSSTTCTPHRAPAELYAHQRAAVPAVQHDLPAGRRAAGPALGAKPPTSCCCPTSSPTGSPASCAPRSRTPRRPGCSTSAPASGRRSSSTGSDIPAELLPPARAARARSGAATAGRRRPSRPSARTTPPRRSSACPPRPSASPTSPAAPGRSSASSSAGPVLTDEAPGRELHQRGRRRRPHPLPAQRRRPVAAPGVACGPGVERRTSPRCSPRPPRLPAGGPVIDVDDPAFIPPGRHARARSRRPPDGRR